MFKQPGNSVYLAFSIVFIGVCSATAQNSPSTTYCFTNGLWFDGQNFRERTFYTANGVLSSDKPDRVDETINLKGAYVVPPYGEAHNHNITSYETEKWIQRYLREGIFYVKNPNNTPSDKSAAATFVNTPDSIDVRFSNGGLTSRGGHPSQMADRNIKAGNWPAADGEGGFYFTVESEADLERIWPRVMAGAPDFIKTFLLYSEEYAARKNDDAFYGWRGLDPALLPAIVAKVHAQGLRVSTHIETAADFRQAVNAGVDEINHTPGFRTQPGVPLDRYVISDKDANAAASKRIFVVTTVSKVHPAAVREMLRANLETLKKAGVAIAVGSDAHEATATIEARYLQRLGCFTNLELLKAWCETTAATIFPGRRIGKLEDGYEASFLVLEGNPIEDFENTGKIRLRMKQGGLLDKFR